MIVDLAIVESLIGIPFVKFGRDPAIGLDCWGGIIELFKRHGIPVADPFATRREETIRLDQAWITSMFAAWQRVEVAVPGTVLIYSRSGLAPDHAGVLVEGRKMYHVLEVPGGIISNIDRKPWPDRLRGCYAHRP